MKWIAITVLLLAGIFGIVFLMLSAQNKTIAQQQVKAAESDTNQWLNLANSNAAASTINAFANLFSSNPSSASD